MWEQYFPIILPSNIDLNEIPSIHYFDNNLDENENQIGQPQWEKEIKAKDYCLQNVINIIITGNLLEVIYCYLLAL